MKVLQSLRASSRRDRQRHKANPAPQRLSYSTESPYQLSKMISLPGSLLICFSGSASSRPEDSITVFFFRGRSGQFVFFLPHAQIKIIVRRFYSEFRQAWVRWGASCILSFSPLA